MEFLNKSVMTHDAHLDVRFDANACFVKISTVKSLRYYHLLSVKVTNYFCIQLFSGYFLTLLYSFRRPVKRLLTRLKYVFVGRINKRT